MAIFEQPIWILVFGALIVAFAAIVWAQTRTGKALVGVFAAIALCFGLLLLERVIQTPRERIRSTIHAAAEALESNQVEAILPFIADDAVEIRRAIQQHLASVRVESVSVKSNDVITLGRGRPARTADAKFNAVGVVRLKLGEGTPITIPKYVVLQLEYRQDRWVIRHYELHDPIGPGKKRNRITDAMSGERPF